MKKTLIVLLIISVFALYGYAQSDYSDYLNKAMEKVEVGDCDAAQRFYNVYKELTGNTSSWVEKAIKDCEDKSKPKTYNIGDDAEDFIGYSGFKIAYLDASGKHGFAIKFDEYTSFTYDNDIYPSIDELKLMYRNRHSLGLNGEYWSSTKDDKKKYTFDHYYTFDYSSGEMRSRETLEVEYKSLLIKRF